MRIEHDRYGRRLAWLIILLGWMGSVGWGQAVRGWPRGASSVKDKLQASPLLVDLNNDQRLEIVVPSFDDKLYVYNHDGTIFQPGASAVWPKTLGFGDGTIASAATGDVNGDGLKEIVVLGDDQNSGNARLQVFQTSGTLLASKSFATSASGKATPCLIDCYHYRSGVTHPGQEILWRDGDGNLHILAWNAGVLEDKCAAEPTKFATTNGTVAQMDRYGSQPITSSVAARDIGNNQTLIAVGSTNGQVYMWTITSSSATEWQVSNPQTLAAPSDSSAWFLGSPAIADLDGNGSLEIVAGANNNKVYVWGQTGTLRANWPTTTTQPVISSPALANLDDDPDLEIVVGCDDGGIYVWNPDGSLLSGWSQSPLVTGGDVFASPVVGEIDGQAGLEIVASSLDGYLYAWDRTCHLLAGWPKRMNTQFYSSPAIGDLHHCGRQAIVALGYNGKVFVMDMSAMSLAPEAGWRQFRGNAERQGRP